MARAIRSASAASITSGCSSIGMCPTPGSRTSVACGSSAAITSLCRKGISASASPAATRTSQPAQRRQGGDAVVRAEGVDEVGQRVHGVRADHRVDEVHARRVDVAVAVGEPAGQRPDEVVPDAPGALDEQRLPAGDQARAPRVTGLRRDRNVPGSPRPATSAAEVARKRDAEHPLGEQLRLLLGQRHDRHAAHRVADQHERAVRRERAQHRGEVVAELVDRAARPRRPLGAPVAALVVDHLPEQRARRGRPGTGAGSARCAGRARSRARARR